MQNHAVLVAALCAATPLLCAQDDAAKPKPAGAAQQATPNPKHAEHEALKQMVGTWHCKMQMPAMPDVKGMEEPTECEATETGELLCNGLWLKWSSDGTMGGDACQGLWLVGYDPFAKKYTSFCISSHESGVSELDGSYDVKTKAWTWNGQCEQGAISSTVTWKDPDTMVEVVRMTPPGAKEPQTMTITRHRSKTVAASVSRGAADPAAAHASLTAEQKSLLRNVGVWDAVVKTAMDPTQPPSEEKGTERVTPICLGRYVWSDFRATMMGQPFEGHCVVGYDASAKQYVSYWFDSMSPTWAKTTGEAGDASQALNLQGRCLCPRGTPMTVKETVSWKDPDTRHALMEFTGEPGTQRIEITYRRQGGKAEKAGK